MKLYIKNMVSMLCILAVQEEFQKIGIAVLKVGLGEVELMEEISPEQYGRIKLALLKSGFEIVDDKKKLLIEKIKNTIINIVRCREDPLPAAFSSYLSKQLGYDYTYLANLFSQIQGSTIEKFLIVQKIDWVKELILYSNLSLTEISYRMHYSSLAHLSAQFKKVTGLTPTDFRERNSNKTV